jgi:DinB superfamily
MAVELVECARVFEELERERSGLLAELGEWPVGRLSFRPAAGAWSAVEVLDHIVRAEAGTIEDVGEGLRDPHALGDEERPGIAALDKALRSDQSFKVPKDAEVILPDAQTTLAEVAGRWEDARVALRGLLEGLRPGDARCGVFHHPFAGWMTFGEVLNHFSGHLYHHQFQLERLRVSSARLQVAELR